MIVVPGSSNRLFAFKLSKQINAKYVETEISEFPDGEVHIKIPRDVKKEDVVVVQSLAVRPNDYLMEFLIICDALRGKGCNNICAVLPYMAYARQDNEFTPGEAISLLGVSRIIQEFCDEVITVDLHLHRYNRITELFRKGKNVSAMPLLGSYLARFNLDNPMVIGPDRESAQWAKQISAIFGNDYQVFTKMRHSPEDVSIRGEIDVRNRDVIVCDDIISTGGTMSEIIKVLKKGGAKRVIAACTHALLAGNAVTRIYGSGAEDLVGTDTVPSEITRVSAVPAVAEVFL
ncbi:MAG: Ribose-phosphate pyrophosphokinase [Candidatus Methanolliviera sp. GoM_oil]|nr:MAG: Ribose-phosphate pyrophosphokinase [Candidatus Methanolliviera sp. GoM_oil]